MQKIIILSVFLLVFLAMGLAFFGCSNPTGGGMEEIDNSVPVKYSVSIPTADEEATTMLNYLRRINWFDQNGYNITLPTTLLVETAKTKLRTGSSLSSVDEAQLREHFKNDIYDSQDYQRSYSTISKLLRTADKYAMEFDRYEKMWGFFIPNNYVINLTLYGPGGSYGTNSMLIKVNREDTWSTSSDNGKPLAIILHESVHIGIEQLIIQRYNISQVVKERIVDNFMIRQFGNIFPGYRLQNWEYSSIDVIFKEDDILDNLPRRVGEFIGSGN